MEELLKRFSTGVLQFQFYYPLFMAYLWMIGAFYYYLRWEKKTPPFNQPPTLSRYPLVTLMVPCYNEADIVDETIDALDKQKYPNFEIIAINDGSRDDTAMKLDLLSRRYRRLRVIH